MFVASAVAQVCLFDLDYGLPVQVRDTALGIDKEDIPESDVGKEFQLNEQIQRGQTESAFGGGGRPNDMLQQLARTTPYYKVCLAECGKHTRMLQWCASVYGASWRRVLGAAEAAGRLGVQLSRCARVSLCGAGCCTAADQGCLLSDK
jgi:hypothetical protein